jgi:hypothetical protein
VKPLDIARLSGEGFSAALVDFPRGQRIRYQGITLWLGPEGHLECEVESSSAPGQVTAASARDDLLRAAAVVGHVAASSETFALIASSHPLREHLTHTYGGEVVELAWRDGENLQFAPWVPSPHLPNPMAVRGSAWDAAADEKSPDGNYRATIRDAQEIRMGGPTWGALQVHEKAGNRLLAKLDSCSPTFTWSNRSDALAVPQFTHALDQRLVIVSPATGRVRVLPQSYSVLVLHSFDEGVVRGVDSPLYAARPIEVVIDPAI